jgi:hypothetical protein
MASAAGPFPVLIVGSAGAFGTRIAELLSKSNAFDLVLAGRTLRPLEAQAATLTLATGTAARAVVLDAATVSAEALAALQVSLVINASGPFQAGDYTLAHAAIAAGCHYVDLADARAFVTGIGALDAAARAANVLVVSGASSVPGLSSAVVAHYRGAFDSVGTIDMAISPGNAFDPGVATVASVLAGVGQPMRMLLGGAWRTVYGWQGLRRVRFGQAGKRWVGNVDVPDLDLFPQHEPSLNTVRFQAGLEVSLFHFGLWAASWLVRSRLVASLAPLAARLLAIKRLSGRLGSDRGGMTVKIRGKAPGGAPTAVTWVLTAGSGHGPYVPALASVALARRLAAGGETRRGALPCYGLVPLPDILAEAQGLDITCTGKQKPLPP